MELNGLCCQRSCPLNHLFWKSLLSLCFSLVLLSLQSCFTNAVTLMGLASRKPHLYIHRYMPTVLHTYMIYLSICIQAPTFVDTYTGYKYIYTYIHLSISVIDSRLANHLYHSSSLSPTYISSQLDPRRSSSSSSSAFLSRSHRLPHSPCC